MKASMGTYVKSALSSVETAKVLTGAIIKGLHNSNEIKIQGALSNGRVLTLKRISLKDK